MTEGTKAVDAAAALPAAYAIFLPVLEHLSAPLGQLVRGQLVQFERLIGGFDEADLHSQGDFEGLGSLTTHGDIAHIVQSELLLRTEAPLEFLRRLAESETLYHEKEYSDPGVKSLYRLTISVGPGLLGHGRVLALAALFFMARLAAARGAAFHWCYLPRADGAVWFDALSVNTIKRFLRAASYREATVDDVIAAQDLWEKLAPVAPGHAGPRHIDWVIGAVDRLPASLSTRAVSHAGRALGFALLPPVADAPRAAEISVRRNGREARRAIIEFPAETLCLSAINSPFAPTRASSGSPSTGVGPQLVGWEPLYLVVPHESVKLLRVRDGILILISGKRLEIGEAYFVRLAPGVRLAGIRLKTIRNLSVLLQSDRSGKERLIHTAVQLSAEMAPVGARNVRAADAITNHLFKGQHPYALPLLFDGIGATFYSTHGREFAFDFADHGREAGFRVAHDRPPILHANGVHRVVKAKTDDAVFYKILKTSNAVISQYRENDVPIDPDRLFGMVYSGSHSSLAYSVRPNVWTVAGHEVSPCFDTEPYETPLMAKMRDDAIVASIWSDARRGGNGTLCNVDIRGGEITARHTVARMEDMAAIVDLQVTHNGIWAVAADEAGDPAQLLCFHRKNRNTAPQCTRFDLDEFIEKAVDIDPDGVMNG